MMARFNKKLITLSSLLLAGSVNAGGPGFDNVNIDADGDLVINLDADTTSLAEGDGFLQQEVRVGTQTYIQTVIIDPMVTQTVTPIDIPPDITFIIDEGSANGIASLPYIQNDVMVTWIGQNVALDGLGSSTFGFQGTDTASADLAVATFSTSSADVTTDLFLWDNIDFGEAPSLSLPPITYPRIILDMPEVTIPASGRITHIDPAILGGYHVVTLDQNGNEQTILTRPEIITDGNASFGAFAPGTHHLSWVVPIQEGINSAIGITQILRIEPQVSFGPAEVIPAGEGSHVTVPVFLNGWAPQYPVSIEYNVSGNATNPGGHNASAGTITIDSGTKGEITFDTAADSIHDPAEEITFTLHSPQNATLGLKTTQRVSITEAYVAPQLDLHVVQFEYDTNYMHRHRDSIFGPTPTVTASVEVQSFNAVKNFHIDWSGTDNVLLAQSTINNNHLTLDPNNIPPGSYRISAVVTDYTDPEKRQYQLERIILNSDLPNLNETPLRSPDPAHVFPTFEGTTINWPYVPGDQEVIFQPSMLRVSLNNFRYSIEQSPVISSGLKLRQGEISLLANGTRHYISESDIAEHGGPDGGPALYPVDDELIPHQIVDFEISGLTTPGQSVSIVIPQENPIPENPVYRKYMPHAGWVTFTENSNNSLASTNKVNGICPDPEDSAYVSGLTEGDDCIRLTIEDGGPNDADQQANSIIKDPGGVSTAVATATSTTTNNTNSTESKSSGGGGSGLSLLWLLLTLGALRGWHRPGHEQLRNR